MRFNWHRRGKPVAKIRLEFSVTPEDVLDAVLDWLPPPQLVWTDNGEPRLDGDGIERWLAQLDRATVDQLTRDWIRWAGEDEGKSVMLREGRGWDSPAVTALVDRVRAHLEHLHPEWAAIRTRHGEPEVAR